MDNAGKIPIFFVLLDDLNFETLLSHLDLDKIEIMGILTENSDLQVKMPNGREVIVGTFADLDAFLQYADRGIYWILYGLGGGDIKNRAKMSAALQAGGVRREFIINYLTLWNRLWLENMRYAESMDIECFATGISYTEVGLDLDCLPYHSVNLAASTQDLYYGMQTAKYLLEHNVKNSIRFCLIGLAPYSFLYDMAHSFSSSPFCYQYAMVFQEFREDYPHAAFFRNVLNSAWVQVYKNMDIPLDDVDIHYTRYCQKNNHPIAMQQILEFRDVIRAVSGKYNAEVLANNIEYMKSYISVCKEHHVRPIAFVLPFSKIIRQFYPADKLQLFRSILAFFQETMDLACIDLFDLELDYHHFYELAHLNRKGAKAVSTIIRERLQTILDE